MHARKQEYIMPVDILSYMCSPSRVFQLLDRIIIGRMKPAHVVVNIGKTKMTLLLSSPVVKLLPKMTLFGRFVSDIWSDSYTGLAHFDSLLAKDF